MPEFLSDAWIAAFDELLRCHPIGADSATEVSITHTVTGGRPGDRTVEYSVVLSPGGNRVQPGRLVDPTVTFVCDHATAVAVNRGDEQTQAVFLDGRLRVGGNTAALRSARPTLTALGDVAAALRLDTTYAPRAESGARAARAPGPRRAARRPSSAARRCPASGPSPSPR